MSKVNNFEEKHLMLTGNPGVGKSTMLFSLINYIKGFNWVTNWIDVYFFNKVSDFLLGLSILLLITFLIDNERDS